LSRQRNVADAGDIVFRLLLRTAAPSDDARPNRVPLPDCPVRNATDYCRRFFFFRLLLLVVGAEEHASEGTLSLTGVAIHYFCLLTHIRRRRLPVVAILRRF